MLKNLGNVRMKDGRPGRRARTAHRPPGYVPAIRRPALENIRLLMQTTIMVGS
jgi:hypothetical protein